jgi:hypothetical protein
MVAWNEVHIVDLQVLNVNVKIYLPWRSGNLYFCTLF